jgi:putative phage-type endonuclease
MKSKLKVVRIPEYIKEWHTFRKSGIGGSEVGSVLGLNPHETAVRVFHEKIGSVEPRTEDTSFMFWGREHEDKIAETWQYWDGTANGYIENKKAGKIIRRCRNVNGLIINPDYPWLFASVDRLINKEGGVNMLTGEPLKEESVLECKTLSHWAATAWEDGMPIYFLTQIQAYMLILEVDYAEIAILKDGNRFAVEYINRDDNVCEQIVRITKDWWENRVVPAKEAMKSRELAMLEKNGVEAEKQDRIIQSLEPEPDDTEAYREFRSERFLKVREMVEGTMEQLDLCKKDEMLKKIAGRIKKERDLVKNTLIRDIDLAGAEIMDFDAVGKFTYSQKKGQKNRTALVSIKEKPSEEKINEEFSKLDLAY